jgi:hypothetical protein
MHPEKPTFEPIRIASLGKTVFALIDPNGALWVDARSVFDLLGLSWRRWAPVVRLRRSVWGAEDCWDRNGKDTILIPANRAASWLAELSPAVTYVPAMRRLAAIRNSWTAAYAEQRKTGALPAPSKKPTAKAGDSRKRKVTTDTIRRLYVARQRGDSWSGAAAFARCSQTTAKQLALGTYPSVTHNIQQAWEETFGAAFSLKCAKPASRPLPEGGTDPVTGLEAIFAPGKND